MTLRNLKKIVEEAFVSVLIPTVMLERDKEQIVRHEEEHLCACPN